MRFLSGTPGLHIAPGGEVVYTRTGFSGSDPDLTAAFFRFLGAYSGEWVSIAAPADPETVAGSSDDAEAILLSQEARDQIWGLVQSLGDEDRQLVEAVYQHGIAMRDYAKQLGVNVSTISRRHARILGTLHELSTTK